MKSPRINHLGLASTHALIEKGQLSIHRRAALGSSCLRASCGPEEVPNSRYCCELGQAAQPVGHEPRQAREKRDPLMMRVFVVDDEKSIADTLAAIFRMNGYEATAFYNAADALAACEHSCPDFVFTDVQMPGGDGVSLAIQIQTRYPMCRIILITAHAAPEEYLKRARKRGFDFELLNKPIHPVHLMARLLAAA